MSESKRPSLFEDVITFEKAFAQINITVQEAAEAIRRLMDVPEKPTVYFVWYPVVI